LFGHQHVGLAKVVAAQSAMFTGRNFMLINKLIQKVLLGCLALLFTSYATLAADYPSKTIKLIVPYSAGGGGDTTSRFIADLASEIMGVNFIVENKTGGGATIGINAVSKSKPDGYTIGFISTSPITIRPHFMDMPYHPLKDLTYIGQFVSSPIPVVVRADSPWKSLADMTKFAKENPGKLRWSTAGQRGGPHVSVLAALKQEGATSTYIPSKGGAKALAALLGGTIDMAAISDFAAPLASGSVRILAETTNVRSSAAPDAPTLAELGYPLSPAIFFGLAGPAGMSKEVTDKWDVVLAQIMKSEKFLDLLKNMKATPKYANSSDFTKIVHEDFATAGKVLSTMDLK
jgi:tripartite-type tricarboxylate transporter receptor subunit TctC